MRLQIISIALVFVASPLFAQEKFGIHVTGHAVAPTSGELTSVSKRVLDSIGDLEGALGKDFTLVSRTDADLVLWVTDRSSFFPSVDRTTISGSGNQLVVDRQSTGSIPIRRVSAYLIVPGTEYRKRFSAPAIWRWRSAARAVADEVAAWAEQNAATLIGYRENPPELRAVITDLSTRNWNWGDTHYTTVSGTVRNNGAIGIGEGWKIRARFFAPDGTLIAERQEYFFDEAGTSDRFQAGV